MHILSDSDMDQTTNDSQCAPLRVSILTTPDATFSRRASQMRLMCPSQGKHLNSARCTPFGFAQLFDTSVGITGQVDLAELDGPFVKIRLKGRFWHMRNTVLERISNYLKNRIPEILEVDIEDEKQLDDSPENF
ncbi:hypothetical protein C4D60_Mb06t36900 [Musa balbisiana]|uniref:Uncharacterized protein n=1 Tax=Musa balbisiana TaxID=52838 RepID=A0A4S8ITH2_MUSBA|nr:hypothetical protein C4D60_Mb06t36900 [Musa balbisiana]